MCDSNEKCKYCDFKEDNYVNIMTHSVMIVESSHFGGIKYPTKINVRLQKDNKISLHFSQSGSVDNYYFNVDSIKYKFCPMCGKNLEEIKIKTDKES